MDILLAILILLVGVMVYFTYKSVRGLYPRLYNIRDAIGELRRHVMAEHQVTRKETQELKTRATQNRKDLNDIQAKIKRIRVR